MFAYQHRAGKVTQVAAVIATDEIPDGWTRTDQHISIGWEIDGYVITPPDAVRVRETPAERSARATAAADADMGTPLMRALADTLLSDEADLVRFRAALETRHRAIG